MSKQTFAEYALIRSVVLVVSLTLVSCTSNSMGQTFAPRVQSRIMPGTQAMSAKDMITNTKLLPAERQMLLTLFKSAIRHNPNGSRSAANTIVVIGLLDGRGHVVRQFANRPGVTIKPIPQPFNRRPSALMAQPSASPTPHPGTGPYHQLISTAEPLLTESFAYVTLPCSGLVIPAGDGPYVYLGGFTSEGPSSEVESGEQGKVVEIMGEEELTQVTYQPYILVAGNYYSVNVNNGSSYNYPSVENGSGSTGHWICSSVEPEPITLFQSFQYTPAAEMLYPFYWGSCFVNDSFEGSSEIFFAECIGSYYRGEYYNGWDGWVQNIGGGCPDCYLTQTTSIAQPHDEKGNGAYFGPVEWSDMVIGGAGEYQYSYSECVNFPIWGGNECGDTPSSPKNSVILVSNQNLSSPATETVTINNAPGNWH